MIGLADSAAPRRRRLLQVAGAFFLAHGFDTASARGVPAAGPIEQRALATFVDVLLPRDGLSGSATDLGVDQEIWRLAADDDRLARLLALGCQWLDQTGGPPFSRLNAAQHEQLLAWMAASDWNQVPRRFYEIVRQLSVTAYYSDQRSWGGLPLQHPPQPLGYPPPWP